MFQLVEIHHFLKNILHSLLSFHFLGRKHINEMFDFLKKNPYVQIFHLMMDWQRT